MRKKHQKFFSVLSQTVQPLIMASKLTENALSFTPFARASALLGALRYLIDASVEVSSAFDHVEGLLDRLRPFTQRLKLYSGPGNEGIEADLQEHIVKIFSCLLDILARTEYVIKDGRFKKWGKTVFIGGDTELAELLGCLEKLIDEERGMVLAIISAQSRKTAQDVEEIGYNVKQNSELTSKISADVVDIAASIQDMRLERQAERQSAALNGALTTSAMQKTVARYTQYCETILSSTGKWLLDKTGFQRWLSRGTPFLWVTGSPGTGKSCLSAITITTLRSTYRANTLPGHGTANVSIAYFYVKEDEQELRSLENLLKTVAFQIAQADTIFRSHAVGVLNNAENIATPRQMWQSLFISFFVDRSLPNSAMVVLDGLDEMEGSSRCELFRLLDELHADT
jgi:DNA replication protein DnaC